MRIGVIGATGFLGEPVARKLKADGFDVRVISRNKKRAREKLGPDFEYAQADLQDFSTQLLTSALEGCDGLHMNLNSSNDAECKAVEYLGVEKAARAAAKVGLKKISRVVGNFEPNVRHPWLRRAIQSQGINTMMSCGVPFMIFGCTWFMESLAWFVGKEQALMIGEQPLDWHWLNIDDYAAMVSRAFHFDKSDNRIFVMHGPEPHKMLEALKLYCSILHPELPVERISVEAARERAREPGNESLKRMADFMEKFEQYGEWGSPAETNRLLGAPITTIKQWANSIKQN